MNMLDSLRLVSVLNMRPRVRAGQYRMCSNQFDYPCRYMSVDGCYRPVALGHIAFTRTASSKSLALRLRWGNIHCIPCGAWQQSVTATCVIFQSQEPVPPALSNPNHLPANRCQIRSRAETLLRIAENRERIEAKNRPKTVERGGSRS